MLKKYFVVCGLGAFLFTSMLSHARAVPSTQNPVPTPSNRVLGTSHPVKGPLGFAPAPAIPSAGTIIGSLEGTLAFCTSVNPQGAAGYNLIDQLITNGQSAGAVAQVRSSNAYEIAYGQITKQLRAYPRARAIAECKPH